VVTLPTEIGRIDLNELLENVHALICFVCSCISAPVPTGATSRRSGKIDRVPTHSSSHLLSLEANDHEKGQWPPLAPAGRARQRISADTATDTTADPEQQKSCQLPGPAQRKHGKTRKNTASPPLDPALINGASEGGCSQTGASSRGPLEKPK